MRPAVARLVSGLSREARLLVVPQLIEMTDDVDLEQRLEAVREIGEHIAAIDATHVNDGPLTTQDGEQLYVHRVSIDAAIGALDRDTMHGSPLIVGLQWLALNRSRIAELLG